VPSADRASPGAAIAAVTTLGYLGSFTGPPLIGAFAELHDLSGALSLVVLAAVVSCGLASRVLRVSDRSSG
jgi:hypothetical protein